MGHRTFRVAFSKAATDAITFTTYSTLPMTSAMSYRPTIGGLKMPQKKNARVAESNKKQVNEYRH
ncbi:unnamed protein product [Anisakis simplex]|uniref:Secreted protein n=1 Tax=Anisakis simplex TaxID=6269 RepID=A0A0M3KK25_ANISI|nr:unnamed protein product [Anisakis simplex]